MKKNNISPQENIIGTIKKKRSKETGIARCTDLLNDQTLDKVTRTDSETDFSSTESAL